EWKAVALATIHRLVALQARLLGPGNARVMGSIGIVAGRACHVALLEALALTQILHLVSHMIVLRVFGRDRAEVSLQRLPGSVAEGRTAGLDGIAVALGANFQLPLACQKIGANDRRAFVGARMSLVIGDVLLTGTVAALAGNAKNEVVAFVLVARAGLV